MAIVTRDQKAIQNQNRVGGSIGERRAIQQSQPRVAPQAPATHKTLDQFHGGAQKRANLAHFAPKATFQQAKRFSVQGAPAYKRPMHDHIENGRTPVSAGSPRPTDGAILRFLDKIIANAPQQQTARRPAAAVPPALASRPAASRPIASVPQNAKSQFIRSK